MSDAIDCDVHVAPASMEVLEPHLDDYWRSYIDDATIRIADLAYPAGVATTGAAAPAAYEELAPLLDRDATRRAVLSCVVLDGVHRNPHYAAAVATAVNDWLRDEWLARDERLRASLVVSTLDIPAAVEEIERLAGDERFVQVLLPVRSDVPYGNRLYHPLYEAADRHGLRIALHAWGRAGTAPSTTGLTTTYLEDYVSNAHIAEAQLISLVAEGVFARFPDLGVVFAECGFTWLPTLLWRFDKDWKGVWREVPWVKEPPVGLRPPARPVHHRARRTCRPTGGGRPGARDGRQRTAPVRQRRPARPRRVRRTAAARPRPGRREAILRGNATGFYRRGVA